MNRSLIEHGVSQILEGLLGEEWTADRNYSDTPRRVADFYKEIFAPRDYDPTTFPESYNQMIVLAHHVDYTLCPHHLLPVRLDISLAYIPDKQVLGLSKLVRLVQAHFIEPLLQEDLTDIVADQLMKVKGCSGSAVLIKGDHDCMKVRGVKTSGYVVTSAVRGDFKNKQETREEFFRLIR